MQYTAFGEIRASAGITETEYRYVIPAGGTGQLRQAEAGLYYYVARFYDPQIAHFTSADTIVPGAGSAKAFNRYAYTLYNPIRYNDPSGHCVLCVIISGVVAGTVAYFYGIGPAIGRSQDYRGGRFVQNNWKDRKFTDSAGFCGFTALPGDESPGQAAAPCEQG